MKGGIYPGKDGSNWILLLLLIRWACIRNCWVQARGSNPLSSVLYPLSCFPPLTLPFPASLSLSPLHILLCWIHSPASLCPIVAQWLQASIIFTKRKLFKEEISLPGRSTKHSRISSDWVGIGYVPMPAPVTVATRVMCLPQRGSRVRWTQRGKVGLQEKLQCCYQKKSGCGGKGGAGGN